MSDQFARSISHPFNRFGPLSAVAAAAAAHDVDLAEQIARSFTDPSNRAWALSEVAAAAAAHDADRAEQIARSISHPPAQARALSAVAKALDFSQAGRRLRLLADVLRGEAWIETSVLEALAQVDSNTLSTIADCLIHEVSAAAEN